jgi:hypothetical protein
MERFYLIIVPLAVRAAQARDGAKSADDHTFGKKLLDVEY